MPMPYAINEVTMTVPGAAQNAIEQALVAAAADFFGHSGAWRRYWTITTVLDQNEYDLVPDDDQRIRKVAWVRIDGSDLSTVSRFATPDVLSGRHFSWKQHSTPQTLVLDLSDGIAAGRTIELLTWMVPLTLASVPEALDMRYGRDIALGAMCRLMKQPGRPYSSPQLAMEHGRAFRTARSRAYWEALQGDTTFDVRQQTPSDLMGSGL